MNRFDIQLVKLSADQAAQSGLRQIYEEAFPPQERRPWELIDHLPEEFSIYGIKCDGVLKGLITLWKFEGEIAYIEHFAVDSAMRGAGIGASTLAAVRQIASPLPIVLEVEPEGSSPDAARRIGFYRRNGFVDFADFDYIQPPYSPRLPPVKLTIMASDSTVDPRAVAGRLHRSVYGAQDSHGL